MSNDKHQQQQPEKEPVIRFRRVDFINSQCPPWASTVQHECVFSGNGIEIIKSRHAPVLIVRKEGCESHWWLSWANIAGAWTE